MQNRNQRIAAIKQHGGVDAALAAGALHPLQNLSSAEALVIGLLRQGLRKYVGIFGHGNTTLGEELYHYQQNNLVKVYNVRHETEASHIAATLRWQYNEYVAVFTSIGPGALQALAGSLVALSNQLGVFYILGDETSADEGYNMQQIPRREQGLFLKLFSVMGPSYTLHTARALPAALRNARNSTRNPNGESPFYFLFPINVQSEVIDSFNIELLPGSCTAGLQHRIRPDDGDLQKAVNFLRQGGKLAIKLGNGARRLPAPLLAEFIELSSAVLIHGPGAGGVLPASHRYNMGVAGSKGSIAGNFVMENCQSLIVIGARAVCQWDCSATGWLQVQRIVNINTRLEDGQHYQQSLALTGDAELVVTELVKLLRNNPLPTDKLWLEQCAEQKNNWQNYLQNKLDKPIFYDRKFKRPLLSQMAALHTAILFCQRHKLVKYFDAGDVQATGFQLTNDEQCGLTFTECGSSYMGYAISAMVAAGIADHPQYSVAFSGDGSFFMNPQALIDTVKYKVQGMVIIFDNRRMSAISALQQAQFGHDFATDDDVVVDYVSLVTAVQGVQGFFAGYSPQSLNDSLEEALRYPGLAVVHVPVYYGDEQQSEIGAFGRWNVGSWSTEVQELRNRLALA